MLSVFADFSHQRALMSARLQDFTARLPPQLRDAAREYSQKNGLALRELAWNSIYFFLPLWVQRDLGCLITEECFEVAYANACLTYATLIDDELMDERQEECGPKLMAANTYKLEAHLAYGTLFSRASPFWEYCDCLMHSSWEHLLLEKGKRFNPELALAAQEDEIQKAKVNWLKLAAVAVALLSDRRDAIPMLFDHLNHWQLACQKIDDFLDWKSDLKAENYTYFLVRAGAAGRQSEARVYEFIGSGALSEYFAEILRHYYRAGACCLSAKGYLHQHIAELISRLAVLRGRFETFIMARTKRTFGPIRTGDAKGSKHEAVDEDDHW